MLMETYNKNLIPVQFVSVWDGDEIITQANYDPHTKIVSDIEVTDISEIYNTCEREFIRLDNGDEFDVVYDEDNDLHIAQTDSGTMEFKKPFSTAQADGETHEYLEPVGETLARKTAQTDSEEIMLTPLEADKIVLQNACRVAYEKIQVLSMLNTTIAVLTDSTRATLRNALAEATNSDCETIQNEIEFEAYQQTKSIHKEKPMLVNNISSTHINEMQEIIDTLENDRGEIPFGIWKRIVALKTPLKK